MNDFSMALTKFNATTFANLIINSNWEYCLGVGYKTEEIALDINLAVQFVDCYKIILKDLCDFTTVWSGYEAKWFEECD